MTKPCHIRVLLIFSLLVMVTPSKRFLSLKRRGLDVETCNWFIIISGEISVKRVQTGE